MSVLYVLIYVFILALAVEGLWALMGWSAVSWRSVAISMVCGFFGVVIGSLVL